MDGDSRNQDALKGRFGRPLRDYVYVVATDQVYDRIEPFEVIRSPRGMTFALVTIVLVVVGLPFELPVVFPIATALASVFYFGTRALMLMPSGRDEGQRHVFVVFPSNGYWHRAEYIRGRGEVVEVMCSDFGTAIETHKEGLIRGILSGTAFGEEDTHDNPRVTTRIIKTYRRRPSFDLPFVFYPRSSAGFASHFLGILNIGITSPKALMDYVERDGIADESVESTGVTT